MLKAREERKGVEVRSRMKVGAEWVDICIHNLSPGGLMASSVKPPAPRQYVDIRRGSCVIIGKVIWSKGLFFGVKSQDRIDVQAIVLEPRLSKRPAAATDHAGVERRSAARTPTQAELARRAQRSRDIGVVFQWSAIAGCGAAAACVMGVLAYQALVVPLKVITTYLPQ